MARSSAHSLSFSARTRATASSKTARGVSINPTARSTVSPPTGKRVVVCLLLPSALAGGVVSAEAPQAAVYGLCVADPLAWMSADAVLCIPFIKNIMRENYDYLYGSGQKLIER